MNIFLTENYEKQTLEIKSIVSRILGEKISDIKNLKGGGNNRVYKVTTDSGIHYAAKFYFSHDREPRNRLKTEFSTLQFLWENGIKSIPQPILCDQTCSCAVYEYISGNKIPGAAVKEEDIDVLVQFLTQLKELKNREGSQYLSPASDSRFSVQDIVSGIEDRLNRLTPLLEQGEQYIVLQTFLKNEFIPGFIEVTNWCQLRLNQFQMSFAAEITNGEKTLSPSDFGFHNALRRQSGEIAFLDFEYFGWDDAAKMISDCLLHPAWDFPDSLKHRFRDKMLSSFATYANLTKRVEIVYPLCGLKWCLLLLNEFIPEYLLRRRFAEVGKLDRSKKQTEQLIKAKQTLHKILTEYDQFSYGS